MQSPVRLLKKDFNTVYGGEICHQQLINIIDKKSQECSQCFQNKTHFCTQTYCQQKKLLCPKCDVYSDDGSHYNHRFMFILPMLKYDIYSDMVRQIRNSLMCLEQLQKLVKQYMDSINKAKNYLNIQIAQIEKLKFKKGYSQMSEKLKYPQSITSLQNLLNNIQIMKPQEADQKLTKIHKQAQKILLNKSKLRQEFSDIDNQYKQFIIKHIIRKEDSKDIIWILNQKKMQHNDSHSYMKILRDVYSNKFSHCQMTFQGNLNPTTAKLLLQNYSTCSSLTLKLKGNININKMNTQPNKVRSELQDLQLHGNLSSLFYVLTLISSVSLEKLSLKIQSFNCNKQQFEHITSAIKSSLPSICNIKIIICQNSISSSSFKDFISIIIQQFQTRLSFFELQIQNQTDRQWGYRSRSFNENQLSQIKHSLRSLYQQGNLIALKAPQFKFMKNHMQESIFFNKKLLWIESKQKLQQKTKNILNKRRQLLYLLAFIYQTTQRGESRYERIKFAKQFILGIDNQTRQYSEYQDWM